MSMLKVANCFVHVFEFGVNSASHVQRLWCAPQYFDSSFFDFLMLFQFLDCGIKALTMYCQ